MDRIAICISGKQRRGKDTVAELLLKQLTDYKRVSVSDLIIAEVASRYKMSISDLTRLKNKDAGVRKLIITTGYEMRDEHGKDYWIDQVLSVSGNIVMPSLRLLDEVKRIKETEWYPVFVRVDCDEEVAMQRGVLTNTNNPTETELDDYQEWDFVVDNSSTLSSLSLQTDRIVEYVSNLKYGLSIGV